MLPYKNFVSYISVSSIVYITIATWSTWIFRDRKHLHIDGEFPRDAVNINGILCHKF